MAQTPAYKKYLKSYEWKVLRITVLRERGHKCERCGAANMLQIHHKTYERLFHEKLEDLEVLCKTCHQKEHNRYKPRSKKKKRLKRGKKGYSLAQKTAIHKKRESVKARKKAMMQPPGSVKYKPEWYLHK